jgi:hypothetical protein
LEQYQVKIHFDLSFELDIKINDTSVIDHTRDNIRPATNSAVFCERLFLAGGKIDLDFIILAAVRTLVFD